MDHTLWFDGRLHRPKAAARRQRRSFAGEERLVSEFVEAWKAVAARVQFHLETDEELRRQLRRLIVGLVEEPESRAEEAKTPEAAPLEPASIPPVPPQFVPDEPRPSLSDVHGNGVSRGGEHRPAEKLPELTFGRLPTEDRAPRTDFDRFRSEFGENDLEVIEARARLKGNACRWAAERRRRLAAGADKATEITPFDRELIAPARELPNCFLWMCHQTAPDPIDVGDYEILAHGFDNLSRATSVVRSLREAGSNDHAELERALDLLAESQSAVRSGVAALNGPTHDTDQMAAFNWLRDTASEIGYFIRRHMKLDDIADRRNWSDLEKRIAALEERVEDSGKRSRRRSKLIGKIRHKLSVIEAEPERADGEWASIAETVEELVSDGLAPSNREVRELLLPVVDEMPDIDPMPRGFQLVLQAIDQHLAHDSEEQPEAPIPETPEVVRETAALLEGKAIVLIGGDRRQPAEKALIESFGLSRLDWIETREHQSISGFEPWIARPDVAAVLLAIRWSSHSFGEVKEFCDRHGKPLVRLPSGYNPSQVATQIQAQCSGRLRTVE